MYIIVIAYSQIRIAALLVLYIICTVSHRYIFRFKFQALSVNFHYCGKFLSLIHI